MLSKYIEKEIVITHRELIAPLLGVASYIKILLKILDCLARIYNSFAGLVSTCLVCNPSQLLQMVISPFLSLAYMKTVLIILLANTLMFNSGFSLAFWPPHFFFLTPF